MKYERVFGSNVALKFFVNIIFPNVIPVYETSKTVKSSINRMCFSIDIVRHLLSINYLDTWIQ